MYVVGQMARPRARRLGAGPGLGLKWDNCDAGRAGPDLDIFLRAGPGPGLIIQFAGRARARPGPQIIFAGRAWA